MNKIILLITVALFTIQSTFSQKVNRYTVKSGHVEYKLTGNTSGTKTLWFDDYGLKSFTEVKSKTVTKMLGVKDESQEHSILIVSGSEIYNIDMLKGTGYKMQNEFSSAFEEVASQMTEAEREKMGKQMLHDLGGEIIGTEMVLGRRCVVVEMMGAKSWLYKNLALKMESKIMGIEVNEMAEKFDENITIPASKFEPPQNIEFEDMTQQAQAYMNSQQNDYEEMLEEEEDEAEIDIVPVNYPFEDFQEAMSNFNPDGFTRTMVMNRDGQHIALYMNGLAQMISIIATSEENVEGNDSEFSEFESFNRGGKSMRYGVLEEDGTISDALLVKYPNYDMYIIVMGLPATDRNTLAGWHDQLDF